MKKILGIMSCMVGIMVLFAGYFKMPNANLIVEWLVVLIMLGFFVLGAWLLDLV